MIKASIVGGSGYAGGEVLRLLLDHPEVEVGQATSESHLGEYIYQQHPNLRKRTQLKFTSRTQLEACDVLFLALPHGQAQNEIESYASLAPKSSIFRPISASKTRLYIKNITRRACRAGLDGQIRLRPAGAAPRRNARRQLYQRGGLQRHGLDPGAVCRWSE